MGEARRKLEAFRVSPREHRELGLLAKARGMTKSDLLRVLVREAAERETGNNHARASEARSGTPASSAGK